MKVALVQVNRKDRILKTDHAHCGLAYIGAYVLNLGHEVLAIDAIYEGIDNSEVTKRLISFAPDIVGFTAKTPDIREVENIARVIKLKFANCTVVVGGSHITGLGERVLLECEEFDLAVVGEGEFAFSEVLQNMENGKDFSNIKGIIYRDDKGIVTTMPRELILDLDCLPHPAWELFPAGKGKSIFSSRGCPYNCIFCQRVMGKHVRQMSVSYIIKEIKLCIYRYGSRFFQIEDEVFGLNKSWIIEFLSQLKKQGLHKKIKWAANSRVNLANEGLYREMHECGCKILCFGIESGNQRILDNVAKGFKLSEAENAIRIAQKVGLQTHCFFILGHPFETKKTIRDTINFACRLNPTDVSFGIMVPYPGTKVYEMARNGEGEYVGFHENWEQYTKYFGSGLELKNVSRTALNRYQYQAYIEFILRNRRFDILKSLLKKFFEKQS